MVLFGLLWLKSKTSLFYDCIDVDKIIYEPLIEKVQKRSDTF